MIRGLWVAALLAVSTSAFAGDLTVEWTTQPGAQIDKEVAIYGEGAQGPEDPRALKLLITKEATKATVPEAAIRTAFPATTWLGISARPVGDTKWWTHPDGSYTYVPWKPAAVIPPVVIQPPPVQPPPIVDSVRDILAKALDKCLAKPVQKHETCMKTLRDALKKEAK